MLKKLMTLLLLLMLGVMLTTDVGCKAKGEIDDDGVEVDIDKT